MGEGGTVGYRREIGGGWEGSTTELGNDFGQFVRTGWENNNGCSHHAFGWIYYSHDRRNAHDVMVQTEEIERRWSSKME